ncbi:MAG TPA: hypothetical protein PKE16_19010, partial [Hyphomicrobium sp.]|nr:hypothetical protein [Hyphomicrobium sp.]
THDAAAASAKPASTAEGTAADNAVKLDLAEISTTGSTSVFAGRAAPGASVTVLENGVAVATATANANGDWSLATDHKFGGPDPKFTLMAGTPKAREETSGGENKTLAGNPRPAATTPEAQKQPTSPSVALLKNFESVVATAREEAQAQSRADSPAVAPDGPPAAAPSASGSSSVAEVRASAPAAGSGSDSARLPSATIPVPMTFVFDEATLTSDGEKTAKLLLDYVMLKKFRSIALTGHADERGTADYNMDLSRKRLDTVAAFLRGGGYHGELKLIPEGSTQPFAGIDRTKFSRDDLMQLDRRVELQNAM